MGQVAAVHRSGTHACTLRRRGQQHALLRVASLAHVDDFKIVEVRAPLVVAARAATVEKGVWHKALPATPALTAERSREQVGEDPMRLGATSHARAHGISVEEVHQRVVVHAPGADALSCRLEGGCESKAPGIEEQRALRAAGAPNWPAYAKGGCQWGWCAQVDGDELALSLG